MVSTKSTKQQPLYTILLNTPKATAALAATQRQNTILHLLRLATSAPGGDPKVTHSLRNPIRTRASPPKPAPRATSLQLRPSPWEPHIPGSSAPVSDTVLRRLWMGLNWTRSGGMLSCPYRRPTYRQMRVRM